jgi:phosphatidylglycerophosphatase C
MKREGYYIYDFDHTIYAGDSTVDFFLFCIRTSPKCLWRIPEIFIGFLRYHLHLCNKTQLKQAFFSFLKNVPDVDESVKQFWELNKWKIKSFYENTSHNNDVIISASPEFLLEPICKQLGVVHLIGSRVDKKNGKFTGDNCYGVEKIRRLEEKLGDCQIEQFYSDSLSDLPLAKLAKKAFMVKRERIDPWD